jgi:hypothetical protein
VDRRLDDAELRRRHDRARHLRRSLLDVAELLGLSRGAVLLAGRVVRSADARRPSRADAHVVDGGELARERRSQAVRRQLDTGVGEGEDGSYDRSTGSSSGPAGAEPADERRAVRHPDPRRTSVRDRSEMRSTCSPSSISRHSSSRRASTGPSARTVVPALPPAVPGLGELSRSARVSRARSADYAPLTSGGFPEPDFNFRSVRGSAVVRWEFRPGSALYVVWNENRADVVPVGDSASRRICARSRPRRRMTCSW